MEKLVDSIARHPIEPEPRTLPPIGLYNQVRSEHELLRDSYQEAKKNLEDGNFAAAAAVCDKWLEKYPNHALFQSLKLDVGEGERQALSAFIARVDREVQDEADLDRKVSILEAAMARYPSEPHFEQGLKSVSARREHINGIVARAQNLEERGQYAEALNQWQMLRTVYRQYPGLEYEIERLERRREQQANADRKTRLIDLIDAAIHAGDFAVALKTVSEAKTEFPDDPEFGPLEKLAEDGIARLVKAEQLINEGQSLIGNQQFEDGLKLIEEAVSLDERSLVARAVLMEALLNEAKALLDTDWQKADALVRRALGLDASSTHAKSLRLLIADRKKETAVKEFLSRARQLQAEGRVMDAAAEVDRGLVAFPGEPRLTALAENLHNSAGDSTRQSERKRDLETAKEIERKAATAIPGPEFEELFDVASSLARKYPG